MRENKKEVIPLFILRTAIGWLFLHEGLHKVIHSGWTARYYLSHSDGPLQSLFEWLQANPGLMNTVDILMIGGLMSIGLSLMLGIFERWGAVAGMVLLALFYLSYPPFSDLATGHTEGNYLVVDKNLVLFCALWLIYRMRPGMHLGIDYFFQSKRLSNLTN